MRITDMLRNEKALRELAAKTDLKGLLPLKVARSVIAFDDAIKPYRAVEKALVEEANKVIAAAPEPDRKAVSDEQIARANTRLAEVQDGEVEFKPVPVLLSEIAPKDGDASFGLTPAALAGLLILGVVKEG